LVGFLKKLCADAKFSVLRYLRYVIVYMNITAVSLVLLRKTGCKEASDIETYKI